MNTELGHSPDKGRDDGHGHDHINPQATVHVTVNGKPVVLTKRHMTGLEIKRAAITQHVAIEITFMLQEELPNGHQKIIGDNDSVEVGNHDRFTAIPNDDNS
jgi:Multiubiquitin